MKIGHFDIRELVPESIWKRYGDSSIWFIDPRVFEFMNFIRNRYGKPVIINTWHTGGKFTERGFRIPTTSIGSKLSQHKFGRAADFNVHGMTPDEVRADIMANQEEFIAAGLTTIEDGEFAPTWVHADCRYTRMDTIKIVKP